MPRAKRQVVSVVRTQLGAAPTCFLRRGFGLRFGVDYTLTFAAMGIVFRGYVAQPDAEFHVDATPGTALEPLA